MCVTVLTLEKELHWENTMQYYMRPGCVNPEFEKVGLFALSQTLW